MIRSFRDRDRKVARKQRGVLTLKAVYSNDISEKVHEKILDVITKIPFDGYTVPVTAFRELIFRNDRDPQKIVTAGYVRSFNPATEEFEVFIVNRFIESIERIKNLAIDVVYDDDDEGNFKRVVRFDLLSQSGEKAEAATDKPTKNHDDRDRDSEGRPPKRNNKFGKKNKRNNPYHDDNEDNPTLGDMFGDSFKSQSSNKPNAENAFPQASAEPTDVEELTEDVQAIPEEAPTVEEAPAEEDVPDEVHVIETDNEDSGGFEPYTSEVGPDYKAPTADDSSYEVDESIEAPVVSGD